MGSELMRIAEGFSIVAEATVYSREDIRFTFKNGMEIKA